MNTLPDAVATDCAPLNQAWREHAAGLMSGPGRAVIDDTDADLNWSAFLRQSVLAQSESAATGSAPAGLTDLMQLRERGMRLRDLAELWQVPAVREQLMHISERGEDTPAASCAAVLSSEGGEIGGMLCELLGAQSDPGAGGGGGGGQGWSMRALLQNAALLGETEYSFRAWLERESRALGEGAFPPTDFRRVITVTEPNGISRRTLEQALQGVMGRVFHRAGGPAAARILCGWQLGLWGREQTACFDLFPYDARHRAALARAAEQGAVVPGSEAGFVHWWHAQPGLESVPPCAASECLARALAAAA